MINSIYRLFYEKQPESIDAFTPVDNLSVTFLNPYSLYKAVPSELYENFTYIGSDAVLPLYLNKLFNAKPFSRFSFDMSSVAPYIMGYAVEKKKSIYLLGADDSSINKFVENIRFDYPQLNIIGFHNGYISSCKSEVFTEIIQKQPDLVIIGMGTPLQDSTSVELRQFGYKGAIDTSGGFFHQRASNLYYFPKWVNRLNIRALYRIVQEPYVLKRIVCYWPKFIFTYSRFLMRYRKQLKDK